MNLPIKENKEHVIQWSLPDGHGTFSEGSFKGNFSLSGAAIVINVEPDKQYELKWGELLDFVKAGGVETDTLLREENEKLKAVNNDLINAAQGLNSEVAHLNTVVRTYEVETAQLRSQNLETNDLNKTIHDELKSDNEALVKRVAELEDIRASLLSIHGSMSGELSDLNAENKRLRGSTGEDRRH